MARRVFFSFHYSRDAWRAGQVRNSGVISGSDAAGFFDSVDWETLQRQGDSAIQRWIDGQMNGTSVTVVLIGAETAQRPWVQYEINKSWERGNGIIGVYIHNIKDQHRTTDVPGEDPFVKLGYTGIQTFDWINNDGRSELGNWVEEAYQRAQKRKKA